MGKLRLGLVAMALLAAVWTPAGAPLPELDRFLSYGNKALESGDAVAAEAASKAILLDEVRFTLGPASPERQAIARAAMRSWEQALDGEVRFVEVAPSAAQLTFEWKPAVGHEGNHVGGLATWRRAVQRRGSECRAVYTAQIELSITAPDGTALNRDQMMQCALHEVGHILGLDDCRERGEVMSPLDMAKPVPQITKADLDALRAIRAKAYSLRVSARALN